jgi:2,3-bisphosphoglycerate-dependent phosphoglycerate mutase
MRLYLIRHAESANNAIYSSQGNYSQRSPDPEITDVGHRQAELLAQHLADPAGEPRQHPFYPSGGPHYGLTHLYCSLMTRAMLTAGYVARACAIPVVAHPDMFERGGIYQLNSAGQAVGLPGPARTYFSEHFPHHILPEQLDARGWYNRPAESDDAFLSRVRAVVGDIRRQHEQTDDVVALVVHGDFIDQFVNELMGVRRKPENYHGHWEANWAFHNTSVSRIDFVNGAHSVVYLNRLDHLPAPLITW